MNNFTPKISATGRNSFKSFVATLGLFLALILSSSSFAQSPTNGGFENGTTGWTTAGSASTTNARTGVNSLAHTTSSTSNVAHTNATTISVPNNSYGITIGWAVGSNANARASAGGTLNVTAGSTAIATIGTTLTRLTYASAQNISGTAQNYSCRVNSRSVSGSTDLYFDDVIMYTSTTATPDLTKPTTASAFTNGTITSSSVGFSWTNGSDVATGIQNTIILRTTNLSAATPTMNDQGVYSVTGGTSGPNIVSTDWTVMSVSVGSGTTSFTDSSVSASTSYKYAVIHRDLAYNYSAALVSGTITTSAGATIGWCNLQYPGTQTITEGGSFTVYGRVYAAGLTDSVGQGAGLTAWVGYSNSNVNPNSGSWTWVAMSYFGDDGTNNDEYSGSLGSGITPGTYYYATRFQIGAGAYSYGGTGGTWNNDNGVLTVNSNVVDFCNVQFPASGTITQGGNFSVYAQVYKAGVTNAGGQGAGITAWIGYSTANTNPNTGGWTWVATTYNTDSGNNDEYVGNIGPSLAPGTYYYASRFQMSGSTEYRYGGTGGFWNSDSGTLTVNAAVPVVSAGSPTGTVGVAFSYNIVATNTPTSYAISSGTLPTGLSLNTTTGAITGTPTAAGSSSVDVTATNTGGTSTAATLSFTIAPGSQTITFGALSNVTYGVAPYALTATASSGLTVTYSSSNNLVATISGSTITIVGAGSTNITASQAGDSNYNAASNVIQSLTVDAKPITISGVTADNKTQDGTTAATLSGTATLVGVETADLSNVTLSGTPTATFATSTPGTGIAVTVTGYTLSGSAAGNYSLTQPIGLTADITGLTAPVATAATTITDVAFDANWNAVSGASSYVLDVSTSPSFFGPTVNVVSWNFPNNPDDAIADGGIAANLSQTIAIGGGVTTLVFTPSGATTNSANAINWQSGSGTKYWEVNFSTQGHYNIKVSSKQRGSNTAPRDFKLQYKIGSGGTYTDVTGGAITGANNYTSGVLSALALPSTCDNQSSVYLRWIMTSNTSVNAGTVAAAGSANIDDILIEGNAPSLLPSYDNLNVGNVLTYPVTGLNPNTT